MLIIALILNMLGIGLFCWLVLTLGVYALPCFVALSVGLAAVHGGTGITSAALVAMLAGAVTLLIGQTAFIWARSSLARAVIAAAFTVPAAIAGYHLAHGLSQIAVPSSLWQHIFNWTGAFAIASTSWKRITSFAEPTALGEACWRNLGRLSWPRRNKDEPQSRSPEA
ncbi:hypothetical protein QA641_39180 [Bradyrhizobium sp. CB1650]|uniref:hypothetical protein n=1 Tax=Bradyrhizobium sp. CB1650 TaxID=3039153 RepID=UPI002434B70A|nr:hypothetical protein [Bradyrhizobium sp. CB1650]WGD51410.1 hypothetical protein QA641_39180 [Bradyrhizobium sp. CB1650]